MNNADDNNQSTNVNPTEEWFVLKGENKFGPYKHMDMVKFLQQKMIFEFDYAWKASFSDWKRIADIEAFSQEELQKLQKYSSDMEDSFFRRNHKRVNFKGDIIVHNNNMLWEGHAVEISTGGVGVIMQNSLCIPGDQLYLHFKPSLGVSAFNAVCEVVSKKYVKGVRDTDAPIRYGLRFLKISKETEKSIEEYSELNQAA
jgi:c-di-GMP-binding flagellar brake protein YcgR